MNTTDKKKRNDFLLIAVVLGFALIALFVYSTTRTHGESVVIRVDGIIHSTYSLSDETRLEIPSATVVDGKNVLIISGGKAYMSEASCPDLICVAHNPISMVGESIVCLPNRVVVTIE